MSNANDADSVASSITRINVCLWVLYSWCRDGGSLEAAYLSSEQALLLAWDKAKEHYTGRNKASKSFDSILETYQQITDCYVDQCLIPYVGLKYAISHAVQSPSSIDVNIKLFDVLGRLSVKGHWVLDALIKSYTATPPTDGENQEQELLRLRLREITKSINLLVVNEYSERFMYSNSGMHGSASTNFPMNSDLALEHIAQECDSSDSFKKMSAAVEGKLPLLLTACRCYRYPVPFHFVEGFVEDIFKQT
ncbi:hypothetical protein [Vibrio vulnificus]|uniref:hypothetical protein n=1 Tax=Vibrio vulnificus TaxID=672 RepID=UPI0020CC92FD|nr:hypothetical protein [Vibrio vulnificus]